MAVRLINLDMGPSPEGEYEDQATTGLGIAKLNDMLRNARAGVLCHKGTKQRTVIPAPVYCPVRQTSLEPWQAVER